MLIFFVLQKLTHICAVGSVSMEVWIVQSREKTVTFIFLFPPPITDCRVWMLVRAERWPGVRVGWREVTVLMRAVGGRDTLSCRGDTRLVKHVIRSNRFSVSNTIISRLSNPCLVSRGHSIYEMGVINLRITFSWDTSTTCSCGKSSLSHIYPSKALGNMQFCVFEVISVSYDLFKLSTKLNVSVPNGPVVNQMVQWDLQKRCN